MFAWADFEIAPEERALISRLVHGLEIDEADQLKVQQWLDRPSKIDELDPT